MANRSRASRLDGDGGAGRLLGRLKKVRGIGDHRWKAICPAHEDRSPSLAVRELADGRVLLHCFAGCEVGSILSAVGLSLEDLFPGSSPVTGCRPEKRPWNAADLLHLVDIESLVVLVVACDVIRGGRLKQSDLVRIQAARDRVSGVIRWLSR